MNHVVVTWFEELGLWHLSLDGILGAGLDTLAALDTFPGVDDGFLADNPDGIGDADDRALGASGAAAGIDLKVGLSRISAATEATG